MITQIIIITALFFGSITDFKKREVPDFISYTLISIGLLLGIFNTIIYSNINYAINSTIGLISGFIIGALFYYTGQWGGGDAKIIMGIGTVIGVPLQTILTQLPIFYVFIISSFMIGAIYGLTWLIGLAINNHKKFIKEYKKQNKEPNTLKKILLILIIVIIISLFFITDKIITTLFIFTILFLALAIYSKPFLKAIEKTSLIKKIPTEKLVEGDWVIDEFTFNKKPFKTGKTGITLEDIELFKKNKIKQVTVKDGIPFVPSFFISYIIILIYGNWPLLIF